MLENVGKMLEYMGKSGEIDDKHMLKIDVKFVEPVPRWKLDEVDTELELKTDGYWMVIGNWMVIVDHHEIDGNWMVIENDDQFLCSALSIPSRTSTCFVLQIMMADAEMRHVMPCCTVFSVFIILPCSYALVNV